MIIRVNEERRRIMMEEWNWYGLMALAAILYLSLRAEDLIVRCCRDSSPDCFDSEEEDGNLRVCRR
jgi:hypothetical protein